MAAASDKPNSDSTPPPCAALALAPLLELLGGDEDAMRDILRVFHNDVRDVADRVAALLRAGELEQARLILHRLKGSSINVGAMPLHEMTKALEAELKTDTWSEEALCAFIAAHRQTLATLERL